MGIRRLNAEQPESFSLNTENLAWAKKLITKYPKNRQASAVIPLLFRAQQQNNGWVSEPAIRYVADMLQMPYIRVLEIATFYTMFNLQPVGTHHLQLCGTTPCMLSGSDDLKKICQHRIGKQMQVSDDGLFSWVEVECLGACVNAPIIQVNEDFFEDLTPEMLNEMFDNCQKGGAFVADSVEKNRVNSAPAGYKPPQAQ